MTVSAENRRGRLIRYVPWIMRDYLTNQGPSTAIVVLLISVLTLGPVLALSNRAPLGQIPEPLAHRLLLAMVEPLVFIGAFFATNGIVANDRKLGTYRFLFAKPISPPLYYCVTFLVYGIGLVAVSLALMGAWSIAIRPMFPIEFFVVVPLMYLAYGGVGFLLSATWRFDWLSLVVVLFVAKVAWKAWEGVEGIRHWILYVLPPAHRDADVYRLVLRDPTAVIPWTSITWLVGYGLACFLLGMLVTRKRPLGTS